MREIDVRSATPHRVTIFAYGASGTGKTRFAATFPRPLFLSDVVEGGYETIRNMSSEDFYEPNRPPRVWGIETPGDMMQGIAKVKALVAEKPGEVMTLVVDSLTFYSDLLFSYLLRSGPKGKTGEPDTRAAYGTLGVNLKEMMIQVHQMGINVVWLALDKLTDDGLSGGPSLAGQSATKLPAACDYIMYLRALRSKDQTVIHEIRSRQFGPFIARGRDEGRLPDPLPGCTYREIAAAAGWALPGAQAAKSNHHQQRPTVQNRRVVTVNR